MVLLIDTREVRLKGRIGSDSQEVASVTGGLVCLPPSYWSQRGNDQVQTLLLQSGVSCEVRQLVLGDMIWIARRQRTSSSCVSDRGVPRPPGALFPDDASCQPPASSSQEHRPSATKEEDEVVLRYIIERKTSNDLARSIMDGR